jgi:hypothetical protein
MRISIRNHMTPPPYQKFIMGQPCRPGRSPKQQPDAVRRRNRNPMILQRTVFIVHLLLLGQTFTFYNNAYVDATPQAMELPISAQGCFGKS